MSVLILHRNPLEPFPYGRWLHDYAGAVVVLAARDRLAPFGEQVPEGDLGYRHLEWLDSFDDVAAVRERALSLANRYGADHVVALHEADLELAAELRERLGLPGARPADVLPFRDKVAMKAQLRAGGIETAPYSVPATAADALEFAGRHGFLLVFKNRSGYNAVGLRILRDQEEFHAYVQSAFRADLVLEAYVPGRMCHVDGLVVGGRTVMAWPSQYQYDLASFGTDSGSRVDVALDIDDPLTKRLLDLVDEALEALRAGSQLRDHAFHAEVFHTPDDRLVVCEIAARPAGAKVREVLEAMFGFNLGEYTIRAELGLPLPALRESVGGGSRPVPARMAGQVLMMKRPGRVRSLPPVPAEDWVERFWLYAVPGQDLPTAGGSADFLVAAVASAPRRDECERRLRDLGERFERQTDIAAHG